MKSPNNTNRNKQTPILLMQTCLNSPTAFFPQLPKQYSKRKYYLNPINSFNSVSKSVHSELVNHKQTNNIPSGQAHIVDEFTKATFLEEYSKLTKVEKAMLNNQSYKSGGNKGKAEYTHLVSERQYKNKVNNSNKLPKAGVNGLLPSVSGFNFRYNLQNMGMLKKPSSNIGMCMTINSIAKQASTTKEPEIHKTSYVTSNRLMPPTKMKINSYRPIIQPQMKQSERISNKNIGKFNTVDKEKKEKTLENFNLKNKLPMRITNIENFEKINSKTFSKFVKVPAKKKRKNSPVKTFTNFKYSCLTSQYGGFSRRDKEPKEEIKELSVIEVIPEDKQIPEVTVTQLYKPKDKI